jgi:hypothetical protein
VRALVLTYYVLLRSVLRLHARLRRCLTRCRHCRIFFLTDPRNAGRLHLGCPFGCRDTHRRRESNRRSADYYRDEAGKKKKRELNARRRRTPLAVAHPTPAPAPPLPWPRRLLLYVRLLVRLIERRSLSLAEVVAMLARTVRQHSMVRTARRDQVIAWLHEGPP